MNNIKCGFKDYEEFKNFVKENEVKFVDVRFCDVPGTWQHFTVPVEAFNEGVIEEGLGFDGSSIRGFQQIEESDMILIPDLSSAFVDPFFDDLTVNIICDVKEPIVLRDYQKDPRGVARRAENYLKTTGIADTAYFGPEAEFFIFDDVKYKYDSRGGMFSIDSVEAWWNSDREEEPNLGHKIRSKEGYFPCPPNDQLQDVRSEMVKAMMKVGLEIEVHHHEVATAGQVEIDIRFNNLLRMADDLMKYKYVAKNVARANGLTVTFMPKPLFGDNGSGMHCHQSLWKGNRPLFYDEKGYAGLSDIALWYIGGLLKHAKSVLAFAAPTTNSYKRLVPHYEAPVNLAYSQRNRSAAVRIPMYTANPKAKRIEFRPPDPSANPYLAFSAMLMAGLDGIENKIDPGKPLDKNIYDLPPEEAKNIPSVPGSLDEALDALEADHEYLLKGGVFSKELIESYIKFKRTQAKELAIRPHPYEFVTLFDI
ncbi:glutamine synthetase [Thermodesulfobium acidiphilum]|uniref:Glutamine synthetase n=1 Tax=Thermodesulfobium acidiphilum TaxID=1794699 RepID=A0A2R4W0T3_THEAF|nr:type I glutamate--ammonia ligase [Thermodesulfobium acidiphilum]AWB10419.1 glutamine synthetase [Thermodesulfobium acidiphilum]